MALVLALAASFLYRYLFVKEQQAILQFQSVKFGFYSLSLICIFIKDFKYTLNAFQKFHIVLENLQLQDFFWLLSLKAQQQERVLQCFFQAERGKGNMVIIVNIERDVRAAVTFERLLRGKLLISLRRSRRLSATISEVDLLITLKKLLPAQTYRSIFS